MDKDKKEVTIIIIFNIEIHTKERISSQEEITTKAIKAIQTILVDTIDKMDTIIKEIKQHTKDRTEENLITSSVKSVIKMDMIGC